MFFIWKVILDLEIYFCHGRTGVYLIFIIIWKLSSRFYQILTPLQLFQNSFFFKSNQFGSKILPSD